MAYNKLARDIDDRHAAWLISFFYGLNGVATDTRYKYCFKRTSNSFVNSFFYQAIGVGMLLNLYLHELSYKLRT